MAEEKEISEVTEEKQILEVTEEKKISEVTEGEEISELEMNKERQISGVAEEEEISESEVTKEKGIPELLEAEMLNEWILVREFPTSKVSMEAVSRLIRIAVTWRDPLYLQKCRLSPGRNFSIDRVAPVAMSYVFTLGASQSPIVTISLPSGDHSIEILSVRRSICWAIPPVWISQTTTETSETQARERPSNE